MSAPGPWTADRALDADGAARAIREALPALDAQEVRLLGQGWDFDAYEVDRRWVFRFPRREAEQTRLRKELALLGWLADAVDVPMPRYAWGELRAPSFPYAFSGYRKLEGLHASTRDRDTVDFERIGHALGASFRALHALEVPDHLRPPLEDAYDAVTPREARDGKARYVEAFVAHEGGTLATRAQRFLTDDALLPPHEEPTPCVLHDDLHVEHLLLDPDDPDRVVAWLDWGDACLGDPARDFSALYPWGGEPLLEAMLAGYGRDDDALRARARWLGLCLGFIDWMHWHRVGNETARAWTTRTLDAALPPLA